MRCRWGGQYPVNKENNHVIAIWPIGINNLQESLLLRDRWNKALHIPDTISYWNPLHHPHLQEASKRLVRSPCSSSLLRCWKHSSTLLFHRSQGIQPSEHCRSSRGSYHCYILHKLSSSYQHILSDWPQHPGNKSAESCEDDREDVLAYDWHYKTADGAHCEQTCTKGKEDWCSYSHDLKKGLRNHRFHYWRTCVL